MTQVVIGTAGHIDHGKTALVKALTGTDSDRLTEEKARGKDTIGTTKNVFNTHNLSSRLLAVNAATFHRYQYRTRYINRLAASNIGGSHSRY